MRFRHHAPDPHLRDVVQGYWELEDVHLAWPEQNYTLPERTMRLMFSAETLMLGPHPGALRPLPPVALTPFTRHPERTVGQGRLRVLVAELYPWGARQLLAWSPDTAPEALDAALSASAWGREVVALVRQGEWTAARGALEAHLRSVTARQGEPGAGVVAARRIYDSLGAARVADLAEELNVSPRTLERQFAQQVGVSPKTLARVVRFDEANTRIRTDPSVPMAELTFDLGFFDQAHLIREFRALSSLTPGAFAAVAARRQNRVDLDLLRVGGDQQLDLDHLPGFEPEPT
ncbi:AraC-like DNA-binding protein [Deinococcus metalli]|uniref:AraC family transcriptional regulator n=1 Tax=Deinococcus metalli TaxID=1141878 RepID=A0A7W8KE21_9DEIO|nr:helix-turn-helix domain-containing protein [Deinococcus metalli]MBB5376436.1 AraC-like DNA-binding protein [Deinococcus metalli]GHF44053.1 AraC family transcriptional regulator [Deinococcus metalli]